MIEIIKQINIFFVRPIIALVRLYQKTISPDHGLLAGRHPYGHCRFYPTCSEYMISALSKYGFFKGVLLGTWRVLRCNPFNRGGYDPVK